MARAKKRRGSRERKRRKKESVLDRLKTEEAQGVLRRLLDAHPKLREEAERLAGSLLGEVDFEAVADEVEEALSAPDLDDLHGRAGRHSWGYVEPDQAAQDILDEAMAPFLADMKRVASLGLEAEALETCKGILLGLYRVRDGGAGELLEWVPDFPAEAADSVLREWRRGARRKGGRGQGGGKPSTFPGDFVERHLPEWQSLIARAVAEP